MLSVKPMYASWMTQYGRIDAAFYEAQNYPDTNVSGELSENMDKCSAAVVSIIPFFSGASFHVKFEFVPKIDLTPRVTYHPMIPNDSEVFDFVANGDLGKLITALEQGTTSLNVRDEEGRSLLRVSPLKTRDWQTLTSISMPACVCSHIYVNIF